MFMFMFIWGDHASRGWYDNPHPVLRPVFVASQCATLCVRSVWMYEWCMAMSYRQCTFCVCECFVLYIYSAQSGCKFLKMLGLCILCPIGHRATQAHLPSQQGHSRLVLWWPDAVRRAKYLSVIWQSALITAQALLFLNVMACPRN